MKQVKPSCRTGIEKVRLNRKLAHETVGIARVRLLHHFRKNSLGFAPESYITAMVDPVLIQEDCYVGVCEEIPPLYTSG